MITLQEACEIAKKEFGISSTSRHRLSEKVNDIGAAWVFGWVYKEDPTMLHTTSLVRVEKDDGKVSDFYLPNDRNFELLDNATDLDVSEYVD